MKIKIALILPALLLATVAQAKATLPTPIPVSSDSNARHTLIAMAGSLTSLKTVSSRYSRKTGETTYAKREINCTNMSWRYLGYGDTLEKMDKSKADKHMSQAINGSIAGDVALFACMNAMQ